MKQWVLIPLVGIMLWSCGKSNSGLGGLLCSIGHNKSAMTVGLNLDLIRQLMLQDPGAGVSNEELQTFLNDVLDRANISPQLLKVDKVDSIQESATDAVRFLELGGNFAAGFGVATKLIKEADQVLGLEEGSLFEFVQESYDVGAAVPHLSKPLSWNSGRGINQQQSLEQFLSYHDLQSSSVAHPDQWAYKQTQWQKAMTHLETLRAASSGASTSDNPVIVAIMDTGVDSEHPDLKDIMWSEGYDALGTSSGTHDENGHGTHCAGIVASQVKTPGTSPLGVAAAVDVRIMPIKVLDKDGSGGFQAIEKGLQWAIHHANSKPDVISMSLGAGLEFADLDENTKALSHTLIQEAIAQNIIVVVAAGNESCPLGGSCQHRQGIFPRSFNEYTVLPCAYQGVICVGASDPDESLAEYSNYSSKKSGATYRSKADVNAPGTNIYSTWPVDLGKYKTISGTSMATPYVAGIAALMKSVKRDLSQAEFLNIISESQVESDDILAKSEEGRLDLYQALVNFGNDNEAGLAVPPPSDYTPPEPTEVDDPAPSNSGTSFTDLWSVMCG
ncbi:MAG: S8 family peptidase [Oligoflexus sp.]